MDNINKGITTYIVDGKEVDESAYRAAQRSKVKGERSKDKKGLKESASGPEGPTPRREVGETGAGKDDNPYNK